jgi:signal peptidase II
MVKNDTGESALRPFSDRALPWAAFGLALAADFCTKTWAARHVDGLFRAVEVVPRLLTLTVTKNHGNAWGFLPTVRAGVARLLFPLLAAAAIAMVLVVRRALEPRGRSPRLALGLGLFLGGALGNLLDRVRFGYVVDFIDLHAGANGIQINLADVAIAAGVALLATPMFTRRASGGVR